MKILIMAYWHEPRFKKKPGGLIRMFELADNLIELGYHVTMVLPKIGFPQTQTIARVIAIPFIDLSFLRPLSFHCLSTIYILFHCLKKIDVIYVRQMNSFLPFMVAKLYGILSYFEIPNDPYIGYSSINKYKQWTIKLIDKLSMLLSDRIIVLSEWSKKRINSIGGIPISKIIVFPSGTDTGLFHPIRKEESCLKLGLDPSCWYVGFIGSLHTYQGIDTLIDAAPFILKKIPNTRFLIVGDGPMREIWGKSIREKSIQSYFIFTGHVPYCNVPDYLGAMDVCVAPHQAETNQASPVKLFDYMASGRPIVASDIEAVREIIAESGCAILIPPDNAEILAKSIILISEDKSLWVDMAEKGRKHAVEKYNRIYLTKKIFILTVFVFLLLYS